MRFASSLSLEPDFDLALEDAVGALRRQLAPEEPHLVLAFPSREHVLDFERVPKRLHEVFPKSLVAGCSAAGVIGGESAIEGKSGIALVGAVLPRVEFRPFRVEPGPLPSLDESPRAWRSLVGIHEPETSLHFLLFADPFTCASETLLRGLDYAYPSAPKVGGLASSASMPGTNALFLGSQTFSSGAVGIAFWGDVRMDPVVAQGGVPIGRRLCVTKHDRNVILELDHRPALEVFEEIVENMGEEFQPERPGAFLVGLQANVLAEDQNPGEFLIRNIVGVDPRVGAIGVADLVHEGQNIQFHVLGPDTAAVELRALLTRYRGSHSSATSGPAGALLFACNGRGENLYGASNHDPDLFRELLGSSVPLAGFFCAGEFGPIGSHTYLHGMTSSFGIFRPSGSQVAPLPLEGSRRIPLRTRNTPPGPLP